MPIIATKPRKAHDIWRVAEPLSYQIVTEEVLYPEDYAGQRDPVAAITQRFTAALEVDSLSVAVNQFRATRQALAGQQAPRLAELKPQLLRQPTTRAVRGLLERWNAALADGG